LEFRYAQVVQTDSPKRVAIGIPFSGIGLDSQSDRYPTNDVPCVSCSRHRQNSGKGKRYKPNGVSEHDGYSNAFEITEEIKKSGGCGTNGNIDDPEPNQIYNSRDGWARDL
jgi:hypothetical protein